MTFDPVLWLLIYLLIGSPIWMYLVCSGDFEGWRPRDAVACSVLIIVGWFPVLLVIACVSAAISRCEEAS